MKTMKEIEQEYARTATMAGDLQYRITTLQEDLRKANRAMRQLNIAAQGIRNAEENAKREAAAAEGASDAKAE